MPEFRIRASGEVVTDLARAFPHASIPQPPKADDLEVLGVDPILEGPRPDAGRFQSVVRSGPEQNNGQWFWVYGLVDWSEGAIAAETEAQWNRVRDMRNARLLECDWTQLPDAPVNAAVWATYRQALRDVTQQSDPFAIVWPVKPE